MPNLAILIDDKDPELGQYFIECFDDINSSINDGNLTIIKIDSENISLRYSILNELEKLIFVGFTHGASNALQTKNGNLTFIDTDDSKYFFDSIFYTTACSCGSELGKELVESGTKTFIGYTDEVNLDDEYKETFMLCENFGIKEFFNTNKNWGEILIETKMLYTEEGDKLISGRDNFSVLAGILLIKNRDLLCLIGNDKISYSDMN